MDASKPAIAPKPSKKAILEAKYNSKQNTSIYSNFQNNSNSNSYSITFDNNGDVPPQIAPKPKLYPKKSEFESDTLKDEKVIAPVKPERNRSVSNLPRSNSEKRPNPPPKPVRKPTLNLTSSGSFNSIMMQQKSGDELYNPATSSLTTSAPPLISKTSTNFIPNINLTQGSGNAIHEGKKYVYPPPRSNAVDIYNSETDRLSTGAVPMAPALMVNNPLTARVRRNWVSYFILNFGAISRGSKLILFLNLALTISQLASGITILILEWDAVCDQPLKKFLVVYLIRVFLAFPLVSYEHLQPEHQSLLDTNHRHRRNQTQTATSTDASNNIPENQHSVNISLGNRAAMSMISPWLNRLKITLDIFGTVWFVIGNYWLFTSTNCSVPLRYLSLVFVVLGYFVLLIPIIICGAVVFCLPCVLVGMRWLRVDYNTKGGQHLGASPDDIKDIPVFFYRKKGSSVALSPRQSQDINGRTLEVEKHHNLQAISTANNTNNISNTVSLTLTVPSPPPKPNKPSRIHAEAFDNSIELNEIVVANNNNNSNNWRGTSRRISISRVNSTQTQPNNSIPFNTIPISTSSLSSVTSSTNNNNANYSIEMNSVESENYEIELDDDDAVCVICLNRYIDKESLRRLYCMHHFHKKCVDEWLRMNKTCPLCVRSITNFS